jgi:hypothetical protein
MSLENKKLPYEPPAIEQTGTFPDVEFNPSDVTVYSWFKCSACSYEYTAKSKHIAKTIVCQCGTPLDVVASWPETVVQRGSVRALEVIMNRASQDATKE